MREDIAEHQKKFIEQEKKAMEDGTDELLIDYFIRHYKEHMAKAKHDKTKEYYEANRGDVL